MESAKAYLLTPAEIEQIKATLAPKFGLTDKQVDSIVKSESESMQRMHDAIASKFQPRPRTIEEINKQRWPYYYQTNLTRQPIRSIPSYLANYAAQNGGWGKTVKNHIGAGFETFYNELWTKRPGRMLWGLYFSVFAIGLYAQGDRIAHHAHRDHQYRGLHP